MIKLTDPNLAWWAAGAAVAGVAIARLLTRSAVTDSSSVLAAAGNYRDTRYAPNAPATVTLFQSAARAAGVPIEWASDPSLHWILSHESDGWVGRPNYHFGELSKTSNVSQWPVVWSAIRDGTWRNLVLPQYRSMPSSAVGLGQLISSNVDAYMPSKRNGIGIPLEEAAGMLAYIKARHGTPAGAQAHYNKAGEGY